MHSKVMFLVSTGYLWPLESYHTLLAEIRNTKTTMLDRSKIKTHVSVNITFAVSRTYEKSGADPDHQKSLLLDGLML